MRFRWVFALLLLGVFSGASLAQNQRHARVLAVHSAGKASRTLSPLDEYLVPVLERGLKVPLDFRSEYLDAVRFPTDATDRELVRYLNARYGSPKLDVIVCVGVEALEFFMRHRAELLPNVPIVFTAIEWRRIQQLRLPENVTGVAHSDDWQAAMRGILHIHPDAKEVVVVGGATQSDVELLEEKKREFAHVEGNVRFRYLNDRPLLEMVDIVRKLPPKTIVFASAFAADVEGRSLADDGALELIYSAANAPVYALVGRNLGDGFVGGPVAAYRERYIQAANLVLRILSGEKASAIPIQNEVPEHAFAFDSRQLKRWGIEPRQLPPGSLVAFQEPSLWVRYRWQILMLLLVVVLQAVSIAVLLVERSHRVRAVRELRQHEKDLRRSQEEIHGLAGKLLTAQEDERRLIARELHDDLGQQAAAIGLMVSALKSSAARSPSVTAQEVRELGDSVFNLAEGLRSLSHELHPVVLEHFGLIAALRGHCQEFTRVTGIEVRLQTPDQGVSLQPAVALCLYRVAQEALRNAAKYSGVKQASVSLSLTGKGIELTIADAGAGFDTAQAMQRGGLGLTSMKERTRLVAGDLLIESAPNRGTAVTVRVPMERLEVRAPAAVEVVAEKTAG